MTLEETLARFDIKSVWHFTDESNFKSISEYGLASLKMIKQQEIKVSRYGADDYSHMLDKVMGLDKYVHLAFMDDHPMYHVAKSRGSIQKGIWLEIPISEILKEGVLFYKEVANKRGAKAMGASQAANNIDFDALLHGRSFDARREARKAEILVPKSIDIKKIIGVHYGS